MELQPPAQPPVARPRPQSSIVLEVRDAGGVARLFYVPACARMTDALAARLAGAGLVLFDGTLWTDDEMIRSGEGRRSISTIAASDGFGLARSYGKPPGRGTARDLDGPRIDGVRGKARWESGAFPWRG